MNLDKRDIYKFSARLEEMKHRLIESLQSRGDGGNIRDQDIESDFVDLQLALEELQVADEELHTQMEELQSIQEIAEIDRRRYHDLFEFAPDAYLVTNTDGTILEANRAAEDLFNITEPHLCGKPLAVLIHETERKSFRQRLGKVVKEHQPQRFETRIIPRHDNDAVDVACTVAPEMDTLDKAKNLRWLIRDIRPEKDMQRALSESEERFRTIFQDAPLGVLLVDQDGKILTSNPAFHKITGYNDNPLQGSSLLDLLDQKDRRSVESAIKQSIQQKGSWLDLKTRFIRSQDDLAWIRMVITSYGANPGKDQTTALAMVEDITAQHRMQAELAELQRRLFDSLEQERNRLAHELHDGPLQELYGVTFQMSTLDKAMEGRAAQAELRSALDVVYRVISSIRSTCGDLKPPVLTPFGLKRAILAFIDQSRSLAPDLLIVHDMDEDSQQLPDHVRLTLFRIFQQACMNTIRHAQATQVEVSLHLNEHEVEMEVRDNGVGFNPPESWLEMVRQGHYGLASSAERAEALGGHLAVTSQPGQGTGVRVVAPYTKIEKEV